MTNRRFRLLLALTAAVAVQLTSGAHAQPAGPGGPPDEATLTANAVVLRNALERGPRYAGIRISDDRRGIDVHTTDVGDASTRRAAKAASVPVRVRAATRSWAELKAIATDVSARTRSLATADSRIVAFGPRVGTNSVRVAVTSLTPEIVERLRSRYGAAVTIERGEAGVEYASRLNDVSPYNAGDAIAMDNGGDCSSGPTVKNTAGKRYLLTAGHCFVSSGTAWTGSYNKRAFNGAHMLTGDAQTFMGWSAAENVNHGYDAALIDTGASGYGWRTGGTNDQGTAVRQAQEFASFENGKVCMSGAFSGERCNATVLATDDEINFAASTGGENWKVHIVTAENLGGYDIAGPGDSGGPVYTVQSNGLWMTGMILGGPPESEGPCTRNNIGPRINRCNTVIWYVNLSSVMNHRGVSLYVP